MGALFIARDTLTREDKLEVERCAPLPWKLDIRCHSRWSLLSLSSSLSPLRFGCWILDIQIPVQWKVMILNQYGALLSLRSIAACLLIICFLISFRHEAS